MGRYLFISFPQVTDVTGESARLHQVSLDTTGGKPFTRGLIWRS